MNEIYYDYKNVNKNQKLFTVESSFDRLYSFDENLSLCSFDP